MLTTPQCFRTKLLVPSIIILDTNPMVYNFLAIALQAVQESCGWELLQYTGLGWPLAVATAGRPSPPCESTFRLDFGRTGTAGSSRFGYTRCFLAPSVLFASCVSLSKTT